MLGHIQGPWGAGCSWVSEVPMHRGASKGGCCPVFSTTALQDLGSQLQRHLTPTPFRFLCLGDFVSWVSGVAAL